MAALAQWTNVGMIDNSVNEMEVHIQQTNDRLQCIRQVANERLILAASDAACPRWTVKKAKVPILETSVGGRS